MDEKEAAGKVALLKNYKKKNYLESLNKIKDYIKAGETYQINFTYDNTLKTEMSEFDVYRYLRKKQQTSYCAFIKNNYHHIASFSPELFFETENGDITVRPMKGTAPRGYNTYEDKKKIDALKTGEKDKAENLMIVDLLRNDLGRICEAGSVKVEELFHVETHSTVHQMTSTISGNLNKAVGFKGIIENIFPCGSVTGAPKIRSMEIIKELESGERDVYCGAIGFCSPDNKMVFNVPIRTLKKSKSDINWVYRVGSGVVWDSDIQKEWQECIDKTAFLTNDVPEHFSLIETIKVENKTLIYGDDHFERMEESAGYFNIPFKKELCFEAINKAIPKNSDSECILRILLHQNGVFECQILPYNKLNSLDVQVSDNNVNSKNVFLYHKTTLRNWYDTAMDRVKKHEIYDEIFINEKGELTEGARSNIFIELDGILYTPNVSAGLLGGILRKNMLAKGECFEKILTLKDLENSNAIYCGNSVRGLVRVNLTRT